MAWYAVYEVVSKRLHSIGSSLPANGLPIEYAYREYAERPDLSQKIWDEITADFIQRPPIERTKLTPDEFWDRLTGAELLAIEQQGWASTQAAARIRLATKIIERADVLDVSLARIRNAVQVFVDAGILTVQRRNELFAPVLE